MNYANERYGRIAVDLDTKIKKKLIDKCFIEGRSMTWIIRELVMDYLDKPCRTRACSDKAGYTNKENRI